jgi:hypothetical protein
MENPKEDTHGREVPDADDEPGRHNRLGFLNVDETDSSSERGSEEEEISEEIDRPE